MNSYPGLYLLDFATIFVTFGKDLAASNKDSPRGKMLPELWIFYQDVLGGSGNFTVENGHSKEGDVGVVMYEMGL